MPREASLRGEHCVPCSTGDRLPPAEQRRLLREVPSWTLDGDRIVRDLMFKDFASALAFANAVGRVAEREDHHPDLHLTDYKRLRVGLTTHAAGGLSRNDFILAARIDALLARPAWRAKVRRARPSARSRPGEEAVAFPMPPL